MAKEYPTIKNLHIGSLVNKVRIAKRASYSDIAKLTGRSITTISKSLNKDSLHASVLWQYSEALSHDFFTDLAIKLNATSEKNLDSARNLFLAELKEVKEENDRLKQELLYLRKAIDMNDKKS